MPMLRRMPCRRQTSAKAAALYWAPVRVETTPRTRPPRSATAISIASVTSEVRMWSAIEQPTTFLEQMSITVARWSHVEPTAIYVMSPHLLFSVSAVKSGITRSGTGGAVLSAIVVRFFLRRCRPTMWLIRISRVTRLRLILCPLARSSAWTRGEEVKDAAGQAARVTQNEARAQVSTVTDQARDSAQHITDSSWQQ